MEKIELLERYCKEKFNTDYKLLSYSENMSILDSIGFQGYCLRFFLYEIKKDLMKELKRIFRIK